MKIMTAATLRNPNNFQNVLAKMREDKLFKQKESRVSAMTEKIIDGISALTPEQRTDQNTVLQVARDSFDPKATAAEKEMAIKMAFGFQKKAQEQKTYNRQQKQFDRDESDYQTQKADTALLAQAKRLSPHGGDEYSVPADKPEAYLDGLSNEGFLNYQANKKAELAQKAKDDLDKRYKESQIFKNYQPTGTANNKAFERNKEEAINSLNAQLASVGGSFDPQTMTIRVPTDKTGGVSENVQRMLIGSGFQAYPVKGGNSKEDKPGLFTGDNYYQTYQLGSFNPGSQPITQPQKPTNTNRKPLSEFDKPADVKKTETAKPNPTPKETKLPDDPSEWDVVEIKKGGKKVKAAMVEGKAIELTPEQIKAWEEAGSFKNSPGGKLLNSKNWKKTDKDLRPEFNPFKRQ